VADAAAREHADRSHLVREAVMALRLSRLMARFESVLWVGGLAHWTRIETRLRTGDFVLPDGQRAGELPARAREERLSQKRPRGWRRVRLAPSALHTITGQTPWKLRRFAQAPLEFEPVEAARELLTEAARRHGQDHRSDSVRDRRPDEWEYERFVKDVCLAEAQGSAAGSRTTRGNHAHLR
jgi:hypothetical protein